MGFLRKGALLPICLTAIAISLGGAYGASAAAAAGGGANFETIGHTALAAVMAADSSGAVGKGLGLLAKWLAGDPGRHTGASEGGESQAPPHGSSAPSPQPEDGSSAIPPASAGSNGTTVPPPPSLLAKPIVAHSLSATDSGEGGPTTTLIDGIALAPPSAPEPIKGAIAAANSISTTPYIWGGGHGSWFARGYDCSGAVSFALFGGGFLTAPLASGALESWGAPGPGRWLTVYANAGHAYAVIAGLRWDTVGDARGSGPRWHPNKADESGGFVARHYPGY
jgi:hypothetical protein